MKSFVGNPSAIIPETLTEEISKYKSACDRRGALAIKCATLFAQQLKELLVLYKNTKRALSLPDEVVPLLKKSKLTIADAFCIFEQCRGMTERGINLDALRKALTDYQRTAEIFSEFTCLLKKLHREESVLVEERICQINRDNSSHTYSHDEAIKILKEKHLRGFLMKKYDIPEERIRHHRLAHKEYAALVTRLLDATVISLAEYEHAKKRPSVKRSLLRKKKFMLENFYLDQAVLAEIYNLPTENDFTYSVAFKNTHRVHVRTAIFTLSSEDKTNILRKTYIKERVEKYENDLDVICKSFCITKMSLRLNFEKTVTDPVMAQYEEEWRIDQIKDQIREMGMYSSLESKSRAEVVTCIDAHIREDTLELNDSRTHKPILFRNDFMKQFVMLKEGFSRDIQMIHTSDFDRRLFDLVYDDVSPSLSEVPKNNTRAFRPILWLLLGALLTMAVVSAIFFATGGLLPLAALIFGSAVAASTLLAKIVVSAIVLAGASAFGALLGGAAKMMIEYCLGHSKSVEQTMMKEEEHEREDMAAEPHDDQKKKRMAFARIPSEPIIMKPMNSPNPSLGLFAHANRPTKRNNGSQPDFTRPLPPSPTSPRQRF